MNVNKASCSDESLRVLLQRHDGDAVPDAILDHVERCGRCQSRLEELAASLEEWRTAGDVLSARFKARQENQDEHESIVRASRWTERPLAWTEAMSRQLLSPPTHPEMLGRLGRYDVERLIGVGGMGIVFKAFDPELNRSVAIKVLAPHLSGYGPARQRFAREARAAAAVVHEHVVPIHNVETEQASPYLVMQFVAGESLQSRLDREGALGVCEVLRIGMQVAAGLAAAHRQGLVHRDIKPANILLESNIERALITDFGLARAADDVSITCTGFHPGTPQYMSPEQAAGETVDARSDLFSLGSVLYAMCTGRPPFRAETSLAVLRRITDSQPRCLREVNPSIPDWLERVVMKLLEKEVSKRFASAQEVAALLGMCLAHVQQPTTNPLPEQIAESTAIRESDQEAASVKRSFFRRRFIVIPLVVATIVAAVLLGANLAAVHIQRMADEFRMANNEAPPVVKRGDFTSVSPMPSGPASGDEAREIDREGLAWHIGFSPIRLKQSPLEGEALASVRYIDEWDGRYSEAERRGFGRQFHVALRSLDRSSPEHFDESINRIIDTTGSLPASYRAALMFDVMMAAHEWQGHEESRRVGYDGSLFERIKHKCAMTGLSKVDEIPVGLALRFLEFATSSQLTMNTDDQPGWSEQRQQKAAMWLAQVERIRSVIDPTWDESDLPEMNNSVEVIRDPKLRAEHAKRLEAERKKAVRYNEQLLARRLFADVSPRMEENLIRLYARKPLNAPQIEEVLQQHLTDAVQRARIAKTVRLLHAILPNGTQLKYGWPDGLAEAGTAGVPRLIEAVRDKSYPQYIRFDGVWALGLIGDPQALPVLREIAEDEATPKHYQDIAREFTKVIQEKLEMQPVD